jgi:hypothetical protein
VEYGNHPENNWTAIVPQEGWKLRTQEQIVVEFSTQIFCNKVIKIKKPINKFVIGFFIF